VLRLRYIRKLTPHEFVANAFVLDQRGILYRNLREGVRSIGIEGSNQGYLANLQTIGDPRDRT
jgi:hypothetical protein